MTEADIFFGYFGEYEIEGTDIFEHIRKNKDDFLWERGFRPAFTEEKYVRFDEKRRIILTPASTFKVDIEPQQKESAEKLLSETKTLIEELRNIINPSAEVRLKDLRYILVFYQTPKPETLLPIWYLSAVGGQKIELKEFRTFVEDVKDEKIRQTEVTLKVLEKKVLEIKIESPDLSLAKNLVDSIRRSCQGE